MSHPTPRSPSLAYRRARRRYVIAFGVLALLTLTVFYLVAFGDRYESAIAEWPQDLVRHFPKTIPAEATGFRMYEAGGFGPSHFIAIRMIVPTSQMTSAIAVAQQAAGPHPAELEPPIGDLSIVDDQDPRTPLPTGFRYYRLVVQRENFAYMAANPDTGELVYWATIH